eukprot:4149993-Prorocentrum_lima.AAC.1
MELATYSRILGFLKLGSDHASIIASFNKSSLETCIHRVPDHSENRSWSVSYTHLTLPTICSV